MNVVFPEKNSLSGEKGAVERVNKGDLQKFIKILGKAANQAKPDRQEEPAAVCEEKVKLTGRLLMNESDVGINCHVQAEVMADNFPLDDIDVFPCTGSMGMAMVANRPVASTEYSSGEGEISAAALPEMSEPEAIILSSTLAAELTTGSEKDSVRMELPKEEAQGTVNGNILARSTEPLLGEKQTVVQEELDENKPSVTKVVETQSGKLAPIQDQPEENKPLVAKVVETQSGKLAPVQDQPEENKPSVAKVVETQSGKLVPVQDQPEENKPLVAKGVETQSGKLVPVQDELKKNGLPQEQSISGGYTGTQMVAGAGNELKTTAVAAGLEAKVIDSIVKEMQLQHTLKDGVGEIRLRLKPDSLGEVLMKISRVDGQVSGRILVENYTVKEVLENKLPLLRERLSNLGIELAEMHVSLGNTSYKESGTGLPERKSWSVPGVRRIGLAAAVSENPSHAMPGRLDILV